MTEYSNDAGTRRTFIKLNLAAAALSLCGGCALFVKKKEPDLSVAPKEGAVRISLAEYPMLGDSGGILIVEVAGMEDKVMVFRRPDGSLSALTMTCTHMGCDVDYDVKEDVIVCPCHGSRYDSFGRNLQGPADQPLTHFPVRIMDDFIIVEGISG